MQKTCLLLLFILQADLSPLGVQVGIVLLNVFP